MRKRPDLLARPGRAADLQAGLRWTTDARDFSDVTVGANPLPAGARLGYPSGRGSPNVAPLTEDASGTPGSTAPSSAVQPGSSDPMPIVAQVPGDGGPSCSYAFYDASADAPDPVSGGQDDQLDLVQGTLGLSSDQKDLRIVMTIKNLSKTIPTESNYNDYEFYWTNPSGDTGPYAVDVQVSSSGTVTYADGTETDTSGEIQFTRSATSAATGSFGSGPDGTIEVDVPLSELGLKVGDTLTGSSAYSATGDNVAVTGTGFIVDQDGPGNSYKLGQPTCIDPGSTTPPTQHTLTLSTAGSGSGQVSSSPTGISCPGTCSAPYDSDTQVTLTAAPAQGSTFAGWSGGGCTGTGTCTVTMSSDQTVTATFTSSGGPPPPALSKLQISPRSSCSRPDGRWPAARTRQPRTARMRAGARRVSMKVSYRLNTLASVTTRSSAYSPAAG